MASHICSHNPTNQGKLGIIGTSPKRRTYTPHDVIENQLEIQGLHLYHVRDV